MLHVRVSILVHVLYLIVLTCAMLHVRVPVLVHVIYLITLHCKLRVFCGIFSYHSSNFVLVLRDNFKYIFRVYETCMA